MVSKLKKWFPSTIPPTTSTMNTFHACFFLGFHCISHQDKLVNPQKMLKRHPNDKPKSHRHTNLTKLDPEIIKTKIGGKQCTQNPISASNRSEKHFFLTFSGNFNCHPRVSSLRPFPPPYPYSQYHEYVSCLFFALLFTVYRIKIN